jgi:hypothetical protein
MTVGPLELVVLGFEGNGFTGEVADELDGLVSAGTIRLVDLAFATKDAEGHLTWAEVQGTTDEHLALGTRLVDQVDRFLTLKDLETFGEASRPTVRRGSCSSSTPGRSASRWPL